MNVENKRNNIAAYNLLSMYFLKYKDYDKASLNLFKAEELFFEEFGKNKGHIEYRSILETKLNLAV